MAKTIMIANNVYEELKEVKKDKSFSEAIKDLIETNKRKTGRDLLKHVGTIKDNEYDKIMKELKPRYRKWTKRYA
ncbi:antitoxin VapB family protein [Candidatus Woesearchaeota archaeon]|nr:antitoxin VapB family protein [Candidatus Woesearchaeota archaeon]